MVLIPPSSKRRGAHGVDVTQLISSLRTALVAEASKETQSLCFRAVGDSVVIEGTVKSRADVERIRRIAERSVGADHLVLRISRLRS
ncbi:hypothetical protein N183_32600 [Sinorhizobium sp. Sb3]|uniref:hypothetical protein n=1 Tax=Sinorhizobium sp. Sb3 TaxID=1358417 RepID=UPI0007278D64|nr:hypothetical protein [Sinorhizobium sp. Sb3]KSV66996.1 hypothetical protein N183_32600 [Sinorhizobium sp. Sb3]